MKIYFLILITILILILIMIRIKVAKAEMSYHKSRVAMHYGRLCVFAVQQMYKEQSGYEKKKKAKEMFSKILSQKGIVITPLEMNIIIEGGVGEKRGFYQNNWNNNDILDTEYEEDLGFQLSANNSQNRDDLQKKNKKMRKKEYIFRTEEFPDPVSDETTFEYDDR